MGVSAELEGVASLIDSCTNFLRNERIVFSDALVQYLWPMNVNKIVGFLDHNLGLQVDEGNT